MKVTRVVRSDDQPAVDCSRWAARYSFAGEVEMSQGAAVFDTPGLRIHPLGTLNAPLLHGETSASPQVTQNDVVVLAGERGTWQVVAPVNGSKGGHSAQGRI